MSPITPCLVMSVLKKRPSGSALGEEDHHLKIYLQTISSWPSYSPNCFSIQTLPTSCCHAKIITIYKSGDTSKPSNCRSIACTSVIAKLFPKIIATRLENYVISTHQKGFLRGINGTHFAVQLILNNAHATHSHSQ